jgi:hypothetical protein
LKPKKKEKNYYKFGDMNTMALQDLLISTFKNHSKNSDCFNSLSIEEIINDYLMAS